MKAGPRLKELQAQIMEMKKNDPEGFAKITDIEWADVPDPNADRGASIQITQVRREDK